MFRSIIFIVGLIVPLCATGSEKTILIMGNSLSAAYGIDAQAGWVPQLRRRLSSTGYPHEVINASVSGETTHGANTRLGVILEEITPDITIVELGGNDGLRGIPLAEVKANLTAIIEKILAAGSRVLLVQILLPPNYGAAYIDEFVTIYKSLALRDNVTLARFILHNIADNPDLMQSDGIHPTAKAQEIMLDNIWPDLYPLLKTDTGR